MPKLPPMARKLVFPKFWKKEVSNSKSLDNPLMPYLPIPHSIPEEDLGILCKLNYLDEYFIKTNQQPGFLAYVKEYINKHTTTLDEQSPQKKADHFQVYKEVFEWIIEAFNTYKPILAAIKREYDLVLDDFTTRLPNQLHIKEFFHTLTQLGIERVTYNYKNEKKDIDQLRKEKRDLRKVLWGLTNDLESVECQIELLDEEYMKEEYRFFCEEEKRKTILSENMTLKSTVQAYQDGKSGSVDGEVIDKKALYKGYLEIKSEHKRASARIRNMAIDYLNNVPKSKYTEALDEFMRLSSIKSELKVEVDDISLKLGKQKKVLKITEREKSYYFHKHQEIKLNNGLMINVEQLLEILILIKKCFHHVTNDTLVPATTNEEEEITQSLFIEDSKHTTNINLAYRQMLEIVLGMPPGTTSRETPEFIRYITYAGKNKSSHDPFNLQPISKRKQSRTSKRRVSHQ